MPQADQSISLNPEFSGKLAALITAEDDVKVVQTLREAMDAEISIRVPRDIGEANQYALIPDWRVRITAAKMMAEIKHGRPRQALDVNIAGRLDAPMSRREAALELLTNWDDVKRIGDEHVKLLKQAIPALPDGNPAQAADAQLVDVDLPS